MGTGTPTGLGILLAPLKDGTLLGNRCLSTLSIALTHILSLSLAAVPIPERSPAGRPGGTLVSHCPPMGIAALGTDQAQGNGTMLLGALLGSGRGELTCSFLGGCQSLARLVAPQADGMEYEVLGPGVVLLHLVSQVCYGPLLSIAVPPHHRGTDFAPGAKCRVWSFSVALSWLNTLRSSGLPQCCSGIRPWVDVGDLCSPASPFCLSLAVWCSPPRCAAHSSRRKGTDRHFACTCCSCVGWGCSLTAKGFFSFFKHLGV